jgi:hypothetical protein
MSSKKVIVTLDSGKKLMYIYWLCSYISMIDIEPLTKIIQLTLQTAFIPADKPTNLLLIAKPETAKTSALNLTSRKKDYIFYTNEITAKIIIDMILPMADRGEIKTVVIPDLLNCIEKQKATREQFLNLIKSAIEEGINHIETYAKKFKCQNPNKPTKFSMITAITTTSFQETRKYLESTGLLSRFIPFSYDYSMEKIKKILKFIEEERQPEIVELKISKKITNIKGNPSLFAEFESISQRIAMEYNGLGFRLQDRLQELAKANAMINGRTEVNRKDIDEIIKLTNWTNFKFNIM